MRILSIDLETFSDIDIDKAGLYRYMESPAFEILLIGYAFDDDNPTVLDLTTMSEPEIESWKKQFRAWFEDETILCHAWNAEFEINGFSRWLGYTLPLDRWRDTMITAMTCGLPRSLKDVGIALGMPEEEAKLREGKRIMTYFCTPCKPSKANGNITRNTRLTDPEKWAKFVEYNRQDVVAERAIWQKVKRYEPTEKEHAAWMLSTEINRRGVMVDRQMAEQAVKLANTYTQEQIEKLKELTGLDNPNSVTQLSGWLGMKSLAKEAVEEELAKADGLRKQVLELRLEIAKSSVKKYEAMLCAVCNDDRVRGMFAFYGANRTGRYSSHIINLQNLVQNHLNDLNLVRRLIKYGDLESIDVFYGNVPSVLSQALRTTFTAKPGYTFAVADFSAIEARLLAWEAKERWAMDAFAAGKDIYCETASKMYHCNVVKHGENGHLRQKGKQAVLGCGYGSNVQGLIKMGALKSGISEEELPSIIEMWRNANPHIVKFWSIFGNAMLEAVETNNIIKLQYGIRVWRTNKLLHVQLPSGRCIRYYDPQIDVNRWGYKTLTYQAYDNGKWLRTDTWGGKGVENLTQGIARDCLIEAMTRVSRRYPDIVMHVHDEMIVEVPEEEADAALKYMCDCMAEPIPWAPGLLLRGDGYTTKFYRKD